MGEEENSENSGRVGSNGWRGEMGAEKDMLCPINSFGYWMGGMSMV